VLQQGIVFAALLLNLADVQPKRYAMRALGIVLIVAGIVMMVITGVNVVSREKVIDLGKVEVTKEKNNPVSWSPIVGTILLVAGVVVVLSNGDTNRKHAV
jgi:uncharacterized membrane protein HdeD (DUF308 family)